MSLRYYQRDAVDSVWKYLRTHDDNPCVVIPTAGGKSHVLAEICREAVQTWHGRALVLTHVKELVEQNAAKLIRLLGTNMVGIYSAGLKSRETDKPVIAAGIQSVYRRIHELGVFNLVVVDEVHLIPPDRGPNSSEGMYRSFLAEMLRRNPGLRVVGLTATPYRMSTGDICSEKNILNNICYEIGVRELIDQGFLSPLISKAGRLKADTSGLHIRAGEFLTNETESLMDTDVLVKSAVGEIVELTADRNACLIFAAGIKHGDHIARIFREEHGIECGFITGSTPVSLRDKIIRRFKGPDELDVEQEQQSALFIEPEKPIEPLKYLCNVNVLTTGFDAPRIDCVAMLRPTASPGLMYQMIGRGFRLHHSKENCLVLDYADNIVRHGPVDCIKAGDRPKGKGDPPAKECPKCRAIIHAGYTVCPHCDHEFPRQEAQHAAHAGNAAVLSGETTIEEYDVQHVSYTVHHKRGADESYPKTLQVDYYVSITEKFSEWLCPEHTGYARGKFVKWWIARTDMPLPDTASDAVAIAEAGGLATAKRITVKSVSGDQFDRVVKYELGDKPAPVTVESKEERLARIRREDSWDDEDFSFTAAPAYSNDFGLTFDDDDIPF
ncbi:MAG: DEAD/DEAH box helicase family protein [Victivallales bacterium]|nr:DEAD/DEAH box helicase family protein [Victivallales bacterium]